MTLTGKDVRVLLGASTLFLHVPFSRIQKRQLSSSEYDKLERLYEELFEDLELQANLFDTDPYMVKVSKRLAVSFSKEFSQEELEIFIDVLSTCIKEARGDTDMNVYFGGDEYGIVLDDFKSILARLEYHDSIDELCK